jgi:hypothetical protein
MLAPDRLSADAAQGHLAMVKLVPLSGPMRIPAMFWTFDRLQFFVWAAKIRNKQACDERIETMPVHDQTQPLAKERAEREQRRVRLWCERKDAMWDAMQSQNAKARATWQSPVWPRR